MSFAISVILPVYNGAAFIEKALASALQQPEVTEILVINDGSTDETATIAAQWAGKHPKIKVLQHPGNKNRGRSASRNLGITQATGSHIAFLDADDFYLENRLTKDAAVFREHSNCDGVYNAIGAHFYREATPQEADQLALTTMQEKVSPEALFENLLYYKKGHFSIDGLTVKLSVFDSVGLFDESLAVGEDTHMFLKMALCSSLHPGILSKPVAMRGVHETNVFNQTELYDTYRLKMYASLLFWGFKKGLPKMQLDHILNMLWIFRYRSKKNLLSHIGYWAFLFLRSPKWLLSTLGIKYFPLIRLRKKLFSRK